MDTAALTRGEIVSVMTAKNVSVLLLYNHEGKILLQHRTKDAPTFPDYWGFFGGAVEKDESPEQAVKREASEELGYAVAIARPLTTQPFTYRGIDHTMHAFIEPYDGSSLTLNEGQGMGWFLTSDIESLLMNDHDRLVIEAMKRFLSRQAF